MFACDLIPGEIYLDSWGVFGQFSHMGSTGMAIMHPWGECDMQSSWAVKVEKITRMATADEANAFRCVVLDDD